MRQAVGWLTPSASAKTDGGDALVGLQHEPEAGQPDPKRELGRMQGGAGRDGELKAAGATRALVEPRSCALPVLPAHQSDGAAIAAGRANPPVGPDHRLEQVPAMVLILEGSDHVRTPW